MVFLGDCKLFLCCRCFIYQSNQSTTSVFCQLLLQLYLSSAICSLERGLQLSMGTQWDIYICIYYLCTDICIVQLFMKLVTESLTLCGNLEWKCLFSFFKRHFPHWHMKPCSTPRWWVWRQHSLITPYLVSLTAAPSSPTKSSGCLLLGPTMLFVCLIPGNVLVVMRDYSFWKISLKVQRWLKMNPHHALHVGQT